MSDLNEIELVLRPQEDGGYHVYVPICRGLIEGAQRLAIPMVKANFWLQKGN
jgi:hypothetical protein